MLSYLLKENKSSRQLKMITQHDEYRREERLWPIK